MNNRRNRCIYHYWAPLYDAWIPLFYGRARQRSITLLDFQPGERLLIPGVGTGLDLPHLPVGAFIVGADYTPEMLIRAKAKGNDENYDGKYNPNHICCPVVSVLANRMHTLQRAAIDHRCGCYADGHDNDNINADPYDDVQLFRGLGGSETDDRTTFPGG